MRAIAQPLWWRRRWWWWWLGPLVVKAWNKWIKKGARNGMKNRVSENMQWPTDRHLKYDYIGLFRFCFLSFSFARCCELLWMRRTVNFCCRQMIFHQPFTSHTPNHIRRWRCEAFIVATKRKKWKKQYEKRIYVIRKPWLLFHKCYYELN